MRACGQCVTEALGILTRKTVPETAELLRRAVAPHVHADENSWDYCARTGEDWTRVEWRRPGLPGTPGWQLPIAGKAHEHVLVEPGLREHLYSNSHSCPWVTHHCTVVHLHWRREP